MTRDRAREIYREIVRQQAAHRKPLVVLSEKVEEELERAGVARKGRVDVEALILLGELEEW